MDIAFSKMVVEGGDSGGGGVAMKVGSVSWWCNVSAAVRKWSNMVICRFSIICSNLVSRLSAFPSGEMYSFPYCDPPS